VKTSTRTPTDRGAPPLPPVDLPAWDVDEGPMRSELCRQIAVLERELTGLVASSCPWETLGTSPLRGPSIQSGESLEQIRDELLRSIEDLCRRIEGGELEAAAAVVPAERERRPRRWRRGAAAPEVPQAASEAPRA
jgi:hypothetical protein